MGDINKKFSAAAAPAATILIRLAVGGIFISEGIQKFLFPALRGVGVFAWVGIPAPQITAPLVGAIEIICGFLLLIGLFTRIAAIPLIVVAAAAILMTKMPLIAKSGAWYMAHMARSDILVLLCLIFLSIAGPGPLSLDDMNKN